VKRRSFVGALAALVAAPKALMALGEENTYVTASEASAYLGEVSRGESIAGDAWVRFGDRTFLPESVDITTPLYGKGTARFSLYLGEVESAPIPFPRECSAGVGEHTLFSGRVEDTIDRGETVLFKCKERLGRRAQGIYDDCTFDIFTSRH
jgi:hypothetical protein